MKAGEDYIMRKEGICQLNVVYYNKLCLKWQVFYAEGMITNV